MAATVYRKTTMKTVTATEAKNNLGSIIAQAQIEPIMVESRGKPTAVVLSMEAFEEYEVARNEKIRSDALAELRELQRDAARRNADLTPEQADAIIEDIVGDAVTRMVAEGKIRYDE